MKKTVFITGILTIVALFQACKETQKTTVQTKEPYIIKVNNEETSFTEFKYVYEKNNLKTDNAYTDKSVRDYINLFTNFRLKVEEAESLGYDTLPEFKSEYNQYKKQLAEPYLTEKNVTEELIKEAFARMQEERKVSHILILAKNDASPEDTLAAYNKILDIQKRVTTENFNEIAKSESQDPSAKDNGGELGYFSVFQMVYPFETAAYSTEVGQISKPVRTRFGYHLLYVHDKRPARGQVKVAHIMIRASEGMDENELKLAEEKINEIKKQLTEGKDWNELCKQFSEDGASASKGGEINWFSAGQLPESFTDASFNLKEKGEISNPVKTAFGWHLIKLIDKKEISTFEDAKQEIESKIARDQRAELPKKAFIAKIKKENNLVINAESKKIAISKVDTSFLENKWKFNDQDNNLTQTLFTIGKDKKVTIGNYLAYISSRQPKATKTNLTVILENLFNEFAENELIEYEKKNLSEKHFDYKMLLNEYRDGILLFKLMDEKVWSKAVKDTLGLEAYHKNNASNYMWDERAEALIINASSKEILNQVKEDLNKGKFITKKYKFNTLEFDQKKIDLNEKTIQELNAVSAALNANPSLSVELFSYTGIEGSTEKNKNLTLERINKVIAFLEEKGISKERIEFNAIGESESKTKYNELIKIVVKNTEYKTLEETYNTSENPLAITVKDGKLDKSEPLFSNVEWKIGEYEYEREGRFVYVKISNLLPSTEKTFNEARGVVISDYQNYLENEWIKELKAKYPVEVVETEIQKMIKN